MRLLRILFGSMLAILVFAGLAFSPVYASELRSTHDSLSLTPLDLIGPHSALTPLDLIGPHSALAPLDLIGPHSDLGAVAKSASPLTPLDLIGPVTLR